MWCTRWFLPLVILPIPTAPPFFLLIFLLSLVLHARPCFYCILLLTALFTSSCYWQPLPLSTPLSKPVGNATTFAEALVANMSAAEAESAALPPVIHLLDRCWCSLASPSGLFAPSDLSLWEKASIERARWRMRSPSPSGDAEDAAATAAAEMTAEGSRLGASSPAATALGVASNERGDTADAQSDQSDESFISRMRRLRALLSFSSTRVDSAAASDKSLPENITRAEGEPKPDLPSPPSSSPQPLLRPYYDLRPYGLDMTIDFSWHRSQIRNQKNSS